MATYELKCGECERSFEIFRQGFLRDEDKVCPECGSTNVQQKITGFLTAFGSSTTSSNCGPRMGKFG